MASASSDSGVNHGPSASDEAPSTELPGQQPEAMPPYHKSVLLNETIEHLRPGPGMLFLDATLGGGGHSEALLRRGASVVAIDQDPVAINYAQQRLAIHGDRFTVIRGNFRDFPDLLRKHQVGLLDGILADIGVSSKQLDDPAKGFSFMHDGPLDLRMDPDGPRTAASMINTLGEAEIARILFDYGEEPAARRIARGIVQSRASKPILTTLELAAVVEKASPRKGPKHPATLTFQALRIAVNDELAAFETFMQAAPLWLKPGGRLAVICFHSLEDRIAKRQLLHRSQPELDRPEWPAPRPNPDYCLQLITRKPLDATAEETKLNPRARSARLRVAERLPTP
jgi:16S rRNA (cytosine1402-N4)-methyltransferase